MNIVFGEFYSNRTKEYLLPCLKGHGKKFVEKYNTVRKLAVGIHDCVLEGTKFTKTKNFYILLDAKSNPLLFQDFISWIRFEPYFVTDYSIEANITDPRKHMVVVTIPQQYEKSYDMFMEGKYSEMYSPEQIKDLFSDHTELRVEVLNKGEKALIKACHFVNEEFGTSIEPKDFKGNEYEMPVKSVHPEMEVFHYELKNVYGNR